LLKYPIELEKVTLFPLLGINIYNEDQKRDFLGIFGVLGIGADFMLTKYLFIRSSIFYGTLYSSHSLGGDFSLMNNRIAAKMALGWRFF
jgi:hypothetical protein